MRVLWTDRATQRLKRIHDFIARDAPGVAQRTVRRILMRSQQIAELPRAGRPVPEYRREDIREILERPYRIIYRIKVDQVDVLAVMHYRQLLPSDAEKL